MDPVINSQLQSPLARNLNHIATDSTAFTYHVEQNAPPMSLHKTYVNAQSSRSGFDQTYSFRLPQYGYLARATLKLSYKIRAVQRTSVTPVLPMYHMVDKVELMSHNNVIETLYGDSMMIKHAYYSTAETAPTKLLGTLNVPPESGSYIDVAQLFKSDQGVPFNPFDSSQWDSTSNERTVTFFLELPFSFTDNPAMYLDTRFVEFLDIQVKLSSTKHGLPLFQAAAAIEFDMGTPNIQLDPRKHVLGIGSTAALQTAAANYADKASSADKMKIVVPDGVKTNLSATADVESWSKEYFDEFEGNSTDTNIAASDHLHSTLACKIGVLEYAEANIQGGSSTTLKFYYRPFATRCTSNNALLAEVSAYTDEFLPYTRGLNTTALPDSSKDINDKGVALSANSNPLLFSGTTSYYSRGKTGSSGVQSGSWSAGWGCDPVELQLGARPRSRLISIKPLWMDGYFPAADKDGIYACAHAGEPRFIRVGACNFKAEHYQYGYWGLQKGTGDFGYNVSGLSDASIVNPNVINNMSGAKHAAPPGAFAGAQQAFQSDVNVKLNAVNWGFYGGQYVYKGSWACTGGAPDWDPKGTSATTDESAIITTSQAVGTVSDVQIEPGNRKGRTEEAAVTGDLEDPFCFANGAVAKTVQTMSNVAGAANNYAGTNFATSEARVKGALLNNDCRFGDGRKAGNTCRSETYVNIDTKTAVIERFYAMYPYLNTNVTSTNGYKWTANADSSGSEGHGSLPSDIIVEGSQINAKEGGVPKSQDVALQLMCTYLHLHDKVREEISMANFKDNMPATILMNDTYQEYSGIKYGTAESSYAVNTDQAMVLPIRSKNLAYSISIVAYRDKTPQHLVCGHVYNAALDGKSPGQSRMDVAMNGDPASTLDGLSREGDPRKLLVGEQGIHGASQAHLCGHRSGSTRKNYSWAGTANSGKEATAKIALSTSTKKTRWSCDGIGSVEVIPTNVTATPDVDADALSKYATAIPLTFEGGARIAQNATAFTTAAGLVAVPMNYSTVAPRSGDPNNAGTALNDCVNIHAIGAASSVEAVVDGSDASGDPNMGPCIVSDPNATWPNYLCVENFKTVKPTYMKLGVAGRTIYETGQGTAQANSYYATSSSGFIGERGAGRWMMEKDMDNLPLHYNKSGERGEMGSIAKLPNLIQDSDYTTSIHDHCDASVITFGLNKTDQLSNNGTLGLSSSTNAQLELKFAEPCRVSVYVHYHATMQIDSNTGVMTRSLDV